MTLRSTLDRQATDRLVCYRLVFFVNASQFQVCGIGCNPASVISYENAVGCVFKGISGDEL